MNIPDYRMTDIFVVSAGHLLLLRIVAGLCLLFAGRRLFWLFVGVVGFFAGFMAASLFLDEQSTWLALPIAAAAGLFWALASLVLQRLAVFLAGFLAGGYILLSLVHEFHGTTGHFSWLFFLLGGAAGAVFLSVVFDWALIFLSSLAGAILLTQAVVPGRELAKLFMVILFVAGYGVQTMEMRKARKKGGI